MSSVSWSCAVHGNLGARRIQHELKRLDNHELGLATVQKVLQQHRTPPLKRSRRKQHTRYARPIPGDQVQMDTCKLAPGLYQYTAVDDDCTRWLVVAIYPRRTAASTLDFIEHVVEQMPFPIQRFQTLPQAVCARSVFALPWTTISCVTSLPRFDASTLTFLR